MPDVCVVTVTYGDRFELLTNTLEASLAAGASEVVVIDNGCSKPVEEQVRARFPDAPITVERLQDNTGSAGGFAAGLRRADEVASPLVLLLDDDNVITAPALDALIEAWTAAAAELGEERCAVLAWRPGHHDLTRQARPPRPGSFLGFHLLDLPTKVMKRLRDQPTQGDLPAYVVLETAPYSGLLFHRSVIRAHGLPREDFVLYADDSEFTYRLTRSGGEIRLIPDALLEENESSWRAEAANASTLSQWLLAGDDRRTYYALRNQAYFETRCKPHHWMYPVNRGIYVSMMRIIARVHRADGRMKVLEKALADARAGRLGKLGQ